MIPKHFRIGRLHLLWWPLKELRGRLEFRWDKSPDGKQVMRNLIDDAVTQRVYAIRSTFARRPGEYDYDGYRTLPDDLGWRFRQTLSIKWKSPCAGVWWAGYPGILRDIREGRHDLNITETWHDAASAEYEYRYRRDWGRDEEDRRIVEEEIEF